jgi:hypothetical protein
VTGCIPVEQTPFTEKSKPMVSVAVSMKGLVTNISGSSLELKLVTFRTIYLALALNYRTIYSA